MKALAISPRGAVAATFAAFGVSAGVWAGASAVIVSRAGIDVTLFGLALTVYTVLYLAAMSGAGALAHRLGVRRALLMALLAMGPALALILIARTPLSLGLALALFGLVGGLMDSTMNAEGARVEHGAGKPIFVQFHAIASGATAIGAAGGGWLAFNNLVWIAATIPQLALLGAAAVVAVVIVERPSDPVVSDGVTRPKAVDAGLAVLGLAVGVCIVCETSALAWGALLLRKTAPDLAVYSGLGAAFFAAFQSAMRFQIDRFRQVASDRTLMLCSYVVATAGLLIVSGNFGFVASALGFAVLGTGTGAIVPCGFSLAARRPGISAGVAISAVSFFGLLPRGPAPLLTGFVADVLSLPSAFFGLAVCMVVAMIGVAAFVPRVSRAFSKPLTSGGVSS